jgi:hypothetical protein
MHCFAMLIVGHIVHTGRVVAVVVVMCFGFHTLVHGNCELRVLRVKVIQEAARRHSCIQSTHMALGGRGGWLNKRPSLPAYQIDKFQNSCIFSTESNTVT